MAKKINSKRILATLMALAMLFNGFQISAQGAENTEPALVQNFEDTYYKQDGTAGTASDWEVHLSKTAAPTATDNVYEITLNIQTKDTSMQLAGATHGAVTLVLDLSNSMKGSPLSNLKTAVANFLDAYAKDANPGDKRLVSVAIFGSDAITIQKWTDVSNAANLKTVKDTVSSLSIKDSYVRLNGSAITIAGTNMEAGLLLGRNLLNQSQSLAGIPVTNQSLILFSDGEPTAGITSTGNTSVSKIEYATSDYGQQTHKEDYDDVSSILSGVSAAKIAVKYNYEDNKGILSTRNFTRVISSNNNSLSVDLVGEASKVITTKTEVQGVTDPMGAGVTMLNVSSSYKEASQQWDLSQYTPVVADGISTYTITYQIQLDPEAVAADAAYPGYTILTPANGVTTLDYTIGEEKTPVSAAFNVPNIRGIRTFTVSYEYEGAVPAGAPALPASAEYKAGAAVDVAAAPTLENYTFSGWSKDDFPMPAEDVVIRGFWSENPKYDYAVTYNANFGENETKADSENLSGTYAASHNITVDANSFARENYTFKGWAETPDGAIAYRKDAVISFAEGGSKVLYAIWDEYPKYDYTVIYNANFGANETRADSENLSGTYAASHNITVDANSFVRDNYTFKGWAEAPDGAVVYQKDAVISFTEGGSKILYAIWEENPKYDYEIIYNANFGANETKSDSENLFGTYAASHSITVDANSFVRANYTFQGWAETPDGAIAYQKDAVISFTEGGSKILYAIWEENPKYDYAVIYNANFGANETKADNENVSGTYAPAYGITVDGNPFARANYTFQGWAETPDGAVAYQKGAVISFTGSGSKTLYAIWAENPKYDYQVIYNANFGANETRADSENVLDTYATSHNITVDANTFVRENYTFQGWAEEPNGNAAFTAGDGIAFIEGGSKVLYAIWEENPKYDYAVIYNANFGANETKSDRENLSGTYAASYGITVDANSFVRENYTFQGWAETPDGAAAYAAGDKISFAGSGSKVLYAIWKENPKYDYAVIYNANFGANETKSDGENVFGTYAASYSITVDANSFVRENYTFQGWAETPDGAVAYQKDAVISFAGSGSKTLYAIWDENPKYSYAVIYNANFGSFDTKADSENLSDTYAASHSIAVDANTFVRENYTFQGWAETSDGAVAYAAGDTISFTKGGSKILYAVWAENPKYDYAVIYNANFGANETKADSENASGTYEASYSIAVDENMFTRANFVFQGWAESSDGAVVYAAGDEISFADSGSKTLYAIWKENPKYDYAVIYNANFDANETKADSENVLDTYAASHTIIVDTNTFRRDHFVFRGWAETPDGAVAYAAGDEISFTGSGSKTLYAVWEKVLYEYKVEYFVKVDDGEYTPFTGTHEETTSFGGTAEFGTVIDEEILIVPDELNDEEYTYTYTHLETVEIGADENVVKVYYQYETTQIQEDDVPLGDLPKTGDPIFVYIGSAAASAAGMIGLVLGKKKEEEEE